MRPVPLILLAILLAALSACDDGKVVEPPPPVKGQISGMVWHRLHPEQPLEGVELSWGEAEDFTDDEGAYLLAGLDAGADSLRLSLAGYHGESKWVEIDGDTLAEGFTLMPVDTDPPLAPLSFTGETVDGSHLLLGWTAPEDETRTGFALTKSPGDPHFQILDGTADSFEDVQVAPLRTYHYTLQCRDAFGNLSDPLELDLEVDTYPTPARLEALPGADYASIPLAWSENADPDFSHFKLYRSDADADSFDLLLYTGTEETYTDEDVEANAVYGYRVYKFDVTGNVSSNVNSKTNAAAQVFLPDFAETSVIHALPGGDDFLAVGRSTGKLRLCDWQGQLLDDLEPSSGYSRWILIDENHILGFGLGNWKFCRVDLGLMEETGGGTHLLGDLSAIAWLGAERLIVSNESAQAPRIVDAESFTMIDTLHLLADTGGGALLAADPDRSLVFVADEPDTARLRVVDLGGAEPILLADTLLLELPYSMRLDADGDILLAFLTPDRVELRDSDDLSLLEFFDLGYSPERLFFAPDGTQVWGANFGTRSAVGDSLFGGEDLGSWKTVELPLEITILENRGLLVVGQSNNTISLIDLDPEDD